MTDPITPERVTLTHCDCGHRWEDHDGSGCLLVSECRCTRSLFSAPSDVTLTLDELAALTDAITPLAPTVARIVAERLRKAASHD